MYILKKQRLIKNRDERRTFGQASHHAEKLKNNSPPPPHVPQYILYNTTIGPSTTMVTSWPLTDYSQVLLPGWIETSLNLIRTKQKFLRLIPEKCPQSPQIPILVFCCCSLYTSNFNALLNAFLLTTAVHRWLNQWFWSFSSTVNKAFLIALCTYGLFFYYFAWAVIAVMSVLPLQPLIDLSYLCLYLHLL